MQERLQLFQLFAKLYDQRRDLLDEILSLESSVAYPREPTPPCRYVQGIVSGSEVHLVSNLVTGRSQSFFSKKALWTLGRDPRQANLVIRDKCLSRCHAAIQYSPADGFVIADLESTNGTFVNGEPVRRVQALQDGNRVRLGSLTFHFLRCQVSQRTQSVEPMEEALRTLRFL
jgi:pSer/pThr/pTyr-binding forkhead associated (FHA) protein